MASGPVGPVLRYLRQVIGRERPGDATDAQLLERFAAQRDQAAFAALVQRHGPMVLGVCRRVLRHEQDAEDAFQATFLVLARKAGSIGRRELVGNWLYGVACRTAAKARAAAARRRVHERHVVAMPAAEPTPEVVWQDLRPVLDEEVQRLPDRYRTPFVLCYLHGLTNEEAARHLGCPKGTVLSRLARARERLRARLSRRGLALSAGLLTTVLSQGAAPAMVPASLGEATVQAGLLYATDPGTTAGGISARALDLTEGVLKAMFVTQLKVAALVLVGLALLGSGAVALLYRAQAGEPKSDQERFQGAWQAVSLEREGPPAAADYVKSMKVVFAANQVTLQAQGQGGNQVGSFQIDPAGRPKTIDIIMGDQARLAGIYEVEKDTLKLCLVEPNHPRPTAFVGKGKQMVIVLTREPAGQGGGSKK
jgi:RNA polymerase sigma factor (sigma-70 family)